MVKRARNSKVECLPTKQNVEIAKFSERFIIMPVLSGRAACNSQHAGALPATGSWGIRAPRSRARGEVPGTVLVNMSRRTM